MQDAHDADGTFIDSSFWRSAHGGEGENTLLCLLFLLPMRICLPFNESLVSICRHRSTGGGCAWGSAGRRGCGAAGGTHTALSENWASCYSKQALSDRWNVVGLPAGVSLHADLCVSSSCCLCNLGHMCVAPVCRLSLAFIAALVYVAFTSLSAQNRRWMHSPITLDGREQMHPDLLGFHAMQRFFLGQHTRY